MLKFLVIVFLTSSCSGIQKMGVRSMVGVLDQASMDLEREASFDFFAESIPANIKTMEGLLAVDTKNQKLLSLLVKAHAGFAFGVKETFYLQDLWRGQEKLSTKEQTIYHYSRAIYYAEKYLSLKNVFFDDLVKTSDEKELQKILSQKLNPQSTDLVVLFFLGQSLGGLINLQKNNPYLLSYLPLMKGVFDWSCNHSPDYSSGFCPLFYGAYEAGRPALLGGNPTRGKNIFLQAIKKYPENYLIRTLYLQYYLIPQMDRVGYDEQKKILFQAQEKFQQKLNWGKNLGGGESKSDSDAINLFNAIAFKRFGFLMASEKNLF